ncbi:hypothetical protein C1H46_033890 [Malus baccata]|uniref:NAC domain-containing protein n=1 Tax=Malus baccata TaxID=106549 RepID=A0A540L236_MALBA|nr:hypothetical protein C1H46_033890 [Malus baccata]
MEEINQFNNNMVPVLNEVGSVDAHIDSPPLGYRFVPTDDELILHYLIRKFMNKQLPINRFRNVNIYQYRNVNIYQYNRFYCTGSQNFGGP